MMPVPHIEPMQEVDEPGCALCVRSVDDCICPECPVCGAAGDPACYGPHMPKERMVREGALVQLLYRCLEKAWKHRGIRKEYRGRNGAEACTWIARVIEQGLADLRVPVPDSPWGEEQWRR